MSGVMIDQSLYRAKKSQAETVSIAISTEALPLHKQRRFTDQCKLETRLVDLLS